MTTLVALIMLVVYSGGIWKFWRGFKRTNFDSNFQNKLILSLLWPALVVSNKSYRQNFNKALQASKR